MSIALAPEPVIAQQPAAPVSSSNPAPVDQRDINISIAVHDLANKQAALLAKLEMAERQIQSMQRDVITFAPVLLRLASHVSAELRLPELLILNEVLVKIQKSLRQILDAVNEGIEFELRTSPIGIRKIRADALSIEQLFSNFALNAREALKDAPVKKFTIETVEVNSHVIVQVRDTGKGMDEELRRQIEAGEKFSTKPDHLGQGMTHMKSILYQLGGYWEIHSVPNEGTTFTLYFPAVKE